MISEVYWQRKIGDYHWGCCWFHSWYWKCEGTVGEETALECWGWASRKRWREHLPLGCWPCRSQSHSPALQPLSVRLSADSSSFFCKLAELGISKAVGHSTTLKGKRKPLNSLLHWANVAYLGQRTTYPSPGVNVGNVHERVVVL